MWERLLAPSGPPAPRPRRAWAFDIAVALLAGLLSRATIGNMARLPTAAVAGLIVAVAAPLVVRRIWPPAVFTWCLLVSAVATRWSLWSMWSPALLVASYTVATLCSRRAAIAAACAQAVAALPAPVSLWQRTTGLSQWLPVTAALAAIAATATMFGLYIGTRRALFEELRVRAQRLEHERDQSAKLAAAEERARIAREMHDIVAHHLTVMVALADGAAAAAACVPDAAAVMRTVSATGRLALSDTRRLLGVLHEPEPGRAARSPLPTLADLDELVERVREAGLPVRYEIEGVAPSLAPGVQLTLYRLVQEALTNTMRHGGPGASTCVRVRYTDDAIDVDIEDDGRGRTGGTPGPGRGLAGMRERVRAYGGEVRSGPRSPGGWAVAARLPLKEIDEP